jgi:DNA-binding FadR family transcriptional regulator
VATREDPRVIRSRIEDDHRALAKAITAGHAQQARSVMEQHIEVIARYHQDAHAARMDDFIEWQ